MKPTTKIQKEISEDQKKLSKITDKHKNHALKYHDKLVSLTYTTKHHCLDCGHEWKADNKETIKKGKCNCPKCETTLKVSKRDEKLFYNSYNYAIIDKVNNKQVVRGFQNKVYYQRGKEKSHSLTEVMQFWILEDGKIHFMVKGRQSFSQYYDAFKSDSEIEFRGTNINIYRSFLYTKYDIYPIKKIIPKLKRNGFKSSFIEIAPQRLISKLLSSSNFETLFKSGKHDLINEIDKHNFNLDRFWSSIKLAVKYDYKPLSYKSWFDYLGMLSEMEKDLKNPKVIFPINLTQAHDLYTKKVAKKRKAEQEIQARIDVLKDRKEYVEKKMMFFNLFFQRDNITIEPLKSVDDFIEEYDNLKHCVFSSSYHKKDSSLILSAKVNGQRTETVEVDLNKFKVIQSRGKFNKSTEFKTKIRSLINSNMEQIRKIQLTA